MRTRSPLVALFILTTAVCLAACGGEGSSTSASSPTSVPPTANIKPGAPAAKLAAQRRKAGPASAFVKPQADNSVPTFGHEAGSPERRSAEVNLAAYLEARAAHDYPAACAALAVPTREGFERLAVSAVKSGKAAGCPGVLRGLLSDTSDPLTGGLVSLRVQGTHAFALFYGPAHQQYIVPMHHEAGGWKPTQPGPIAYPPAAPPTTSP